MDLLEEYGRSLPTDAVYCTLTRKASQVRRFYDTLVGFASRMLTAHFQVKYDIWIQKIEGQELCCFNL